MIAYPFGIWQGEYGIGSYCWLTGAVSYPIRFLCVVLELGCPIVRNSSEVLPTISVLTGAFVVVRSSVDFTDLLLRAYRGYGYLYRKGYIPLHSMCFYFALSHYLYLDSKVDNWKYCINRRDLAIHERATEFRKCFS